MGSFGRVAPLVVLALSVSAQTRGRSVAVAASPAQAAPARRGPVLVVIIVDQLAAWMADERWPALPPDGGFARLRREGLYVRELRFSHAATDTAPGHSALFTGAVPHESGILANETFAAAGAAPTSFLADPTTHVIAAGAAGGEKSSSSLAQLRVATLADALVAARPEARVVSLSLKDRAALFGGGRHPTASVWFDPELAAFVTSTAVATQFPPWAARRADRAAVEAAMARPWQVGDPAWVAAHAETADDGAGESDYLGLGKTFPHVATSAKALRGTPAGDALLFDLAEASVTEMAPTLDGRSFLLALSLSSHDYVAHLFGPHSWEAWDELARLDEALARFLGRLDQLLGSDAYAVMLTGDHGSNALPELSRTAPSPWCRGAEKGGRADHWQRSCGPRQRLSQSELTTALEARLDEVLGREGGPWVVGISDPLLYLTPQARALPPARRQILIRAVTEVLERRFGVSHVVDLRATPSRCPPLADESWRALVCRSSRADAAGDLYLVVESGTFFDPRLAPGAGTSHGSPYLYDRAVPLLVRAPGRVRPGQVAARPVAFTAFARTAAALLEIPPPAAAASGEDLTRAR